MHIRGNEQGRTRLRERRIWQQGANASLETITAGRSSGRVPSRTRVRSLASVVYTFKTRDVFRVTAVINSEALEEHLQTDLHEIHPSRMRAWE